MIESAEIDQSGRERLLFPKSLPRHFPMIISHGLIEKARLLLLTQIFPLPVAPRDDPHVAYPLLEKIPPDSSKKDFQRIIISTYSVLNRPTPNNSPKGVNPLLAREKLGSFIPENPPVFPCSLEKQ